MRPDPAVPSVSALSGGTDTGTHAAARRYATQSLPGIGGVIKQRPEDFLVDEIPAYPPSGSGEHLYLTVQKRGLSTLEMVEILARHFGVRRFAVGYAGLKDKHAITRQVVTVHVPGKKVEDFPLLSHDKVAVVGAEMHANKLRPGHLKGNRFSIRIRGVKPTDVLTAQRALRMLETTGVPNRVGEQRFGLLANNHLIGRALVAGDFDGAVRELLGPSAAHPAQNTEARQLFSEARYTEAIAAYPRAARTEQRVLYQLSKGATPKRAMLSLDDAILRFYHSAFQSAVFNAVLDERLEAGTLDVLAVGDVAFKHDSGAVFAVDEAIEADAATRTRLSRIEISPSGPQWGAAMTRAGGEVGRCEDAALNGAGVTIAQLEAFDAASRLRLEGKRRPFRVPLIAPEVEGGVDEHGAYVRCAFELPRGAFATVALREVMKPEAAGEAWEDGEE